jgi:hypothetical protein
VGIGGIGTGVEVGMEVDVGTMVGVKVDVGRGVTVGGTGVGVEKPTIRHPVNKKRSRLVKIKRGNKILDFMAISY